MRTLTRLSAPCSCVVALVLAGCSGGDTSIRPTVKRSSEPAEKQGGAEKAPVKEGEKQPGNGK